MSPFAAVTETFGSRTTPTISSSLTLSYSYREIFTRYWATFQSSHNCDWAEDDENVYNLLYMERVIAWP